jgi:hypothetical protein
MKREKELARGSREGVSLPGKPGRRTLVIRKAGKRKFIHK